MVPDRAPSLERVREVAPWGVYAVAGTWLRAPASLPDKRGWLSPVGIVTRLAEGWGECGECHQGFVHCPDCSASGVAGPHLASCLTCRGRGAWDCERCNGTGVTDTEPELRRLFDGA